MLKMLLELDSKNLIIAKFTLFFYFLKYFLQKVDIKKA